MRVRLTLWTVAIFVIIQGTFAVVVLLYERQGFLRLRDAALQSVADEVRDEVVGLAPHWERLDLQPQYDNARLSFVGVVETAVLGADGEVLAGSNPFADSKFFELVLREPNASSQFAFLTRERDDGSGELDRFRAYAQRVEGNDHRQYILVTYADSSTVSGVFDVVGQVLYLFGPVSVLGAAAAAWLLAGVAVRPLIQIEDAAKKLSPQTLDAAFDIETTSPEVETLRDELDKAMARLEAGFSAQQRFISNVSHELRTPISILLAEAETLKTREDQPPEISEFIESVIDEMKQLGRLIESFLLLSRVRDGGLEPTNTRTNINDIMLDALDSCGLFAGEEGVRMHPTLVDSDDEAIVRGDPELYRIMIANALRNAIRFSDRDGVVELSGVRDEECVRVFVRDHGAGLPAEFIPQAFDPFRQANGERRMSRGMGLGLSIAKGIAELHHGDIRIGNHPTGGCEVIMRIPLDDASRSTGDCFSGPDGT